MKFFIYLIYQSNLIMDNFKEEKEEDLVDKFEESIFNFRKEFRNFKKKGNDIFEALEDYKRPKSLSKSLLKRVDARIKYIERWERSILRETHINYLKFDSNDINYNDINLVHINSNDIIKLDIGGKIFTTSKRTLMIFKNTYFYGLISNIEKFNDNKDGVIFIDRDPIVFDRVLNYLRTSKLNMIELTPYTKKILKEDFDYYCIPMIGINWGGEDDDDDDDEEIFIISDILDYRPKENITKNNLELKVKFFGSNLQNDESPWFLFYGSRFEENEKVLRFIKSNKLLLRSNENVKFRSKSLINI